MISSLNAEFSEPTFGVMDKYVQSAEQRRGGSQYTPVRQARREFVDEISYAARDIASWRITSEDSRYDGMLLGMGTSRFPGNIITLRLSQAGVDITKKMGKVTPEEFERIEDTGYIDFVGTRFGDVDIAKLRCDFPQHQILSLVPQVDEYDDRPHYYKRSARRLEQFAIGEKKEAVLAMLDFYQKFDEGIDVPDNGITIGRYESPPSLPGPNVVESVKLHPDGKLYVHRKIHVSEEEIRNCAIPLEEFKQVLLREAEMFRPDIGTYYRSYPEMLKELPDAVQLPRIISKGAYENLRRYFKRVSGIHDQKLLWQSTQGKPPNLVPDLLLT